MASGTIRERCATRAAAILAAAAMPGDGGELFEARVRPILEEHCVKCHGPRKPKSGLRLDTIEGIRAGGSRGALFVAGSPAESRIVAALSYEEEGLQMPPRGRLGEGERTAIAEWIATGAELPEYAASPSEASGDEGFDPAELERRKRHWAWQPVADPPVPPVREPGWPLDPIDAFVLARLEAEGLAHAAEAPRASWLRRVTFDLIGLPPTVADQDEFLADARPDAHARVVDRLLASPRFGERWARHWLDLARYAEGRGHEFDHLLPNAWQYRDYLIRAFDADVPYDQLAREHVAGDLLEPPRLDPATGSDESVLGTGFWCLGESVHSPVDLRQDECDRVASQLDTFGKAFLGLTVSCARCHDHKFDAITQRDYYALAGFLAGASERQVPFEARAINREVARAAQAERDACAAAVRAELDAALRARADPSTIERKDSGGFCLGQGVVVLDLSHPRPGDVTFDGVAFGLRPLAAGDVRFTRETERWVAERAPIGMVARDALLDRVRAAPDREIDPCRLKVLEPGRLLRTRSHVLVDGKLHYLLRGKGRLFACVDSHRTLEGPLHGKTLIDFDTGGEWRWVSHDLGDYVGERLHVELSLWPFDEQGNAPDLALAAIVDATEAPAPPDVEPESSMAVAGLPAASALLGRIEALAAGLKDGSRTALALLEGSGFDEPLLRRGNPRNEGEPVPRRFLTAIDGEAPLAAAHQDGGSGRLALAQRLTAPESPLFARVAVNRVWHHLLGRGLVASTDDFGANGARPTHPELLDRLATDFARGGFSIKALIRRIALSRTYRMDSRGEPEDDARDPDLALLHRMPVRRLEAEPLRDAMLAVSGRLDPTRFGPSVPTWLTPFMEGRGRPQSGPLDGAGRRTIYLSVKRNFLAPFLLAFDFPIPAATCGRRSTSNVPAQALALQNGELAHELARAWAERLLAAGAERPAARVERMFREAFARPPREEELDAALDFVADAATSGAGGAEAGAAAAWTDLAHVLLASKGFRFIE